MPEIRFEHGELTEAEQATVAEGFREHTDQQHAPQYAKQRVKWLAFSDDALRGILTADVLWDWIYVDELWVSAESRGEGLGRKLMESIEKYAAAEGLSGVWLWTQSWQAEGFYQRMGYEEFTRFEDFPKGHARIGFRKRVTLNAAS